MSEPVAIIQYPDKYTEVLRLKRLALMFHRIGVHPYKLNRDLDTYIHPTLVFIRVMGGVYLLKKGICQESASGIDYARFTLSQVK